MERHLLSTLLKAAGSHSRSTAMAPLQWSMAILLAGLVGVLATPRAPGWLTVTLAVMFGCLVALYMGAYVFFMVKAPDRLQSERYNISRMRLDSQASDSDSGTVEDVPELKRSGEFHALKPGGESE